jgi:hypothetical protein
MLTGAVVTMLQDDPGSCPAKFPGRGNGPLVWGGAFSLRVHGCVTCSDPKQLETGVAA